MIQNIRQVKAGTTLEGIESSSDIHINVDAKDIALHLLSHCMPPTILMIAGLRSSYAQLSGNIQITVNNTDTGEKLISAKSKIDIHPIITYTSLGDRF